MSKRPFHQNDFLSFVMSDGLMFYELEPVFYERVDATATPRSRQSLTEQLDDALPPDYVAWIRDSCVSNAAGSTEPGDFEGSPGSRIRLKPQTTFLPGWGVVSRSLLRWAFEAAVLVLGSGMLFAAQRNATSNVPKSHMPTIATVMRMNQGSQEACTSDVQGSFVLRKNTIVSENTYPSHCAANVTQGHFSLVSPMKLGKISEPISRAGQLKELNHQLAKFAHVNNTTSIAELLNEHTEKDASIDQVETQNTAETVLAEKTQTETSSTASPVTTKRGTYSLVDYCFDIVHSGEIFFFISFTEKSGGFGVSWPAKNTPAGVSVSYRRQVGQKVPSPHYGEVRIYAKTGFKGYFNHVSLTQTVDANTTFMADPTCSTMDVGVTLGLQLADPELTVKKQGTYGLQRFQGGYIAGMDAKSATSTGGLKLGYRLYEDEIVLFNLHSPPKPNPRASSAGGASNSEGRK